MALSTQSPGNRLRLEVDDPGAFAGAGDAQAIQSFAEAMASQGLVVQVVHDGEPGHTRRRGGNGG